VLHHNRPVTVEQRATLNDIVWQPPNEWGANMVQFIELTKELFARVRILVGRVRPYALFATAVRDATMIA